MGAGADGTNPVMIVGKYSSVFWCAPVLTVKTKARMIEQRTHVVHS